jgi:hypothetical protein
MWNPTTAGADQTNYLLRGQTWLAAAGQIFFSISAGFGIIINYASYLRKKDDVALSSLTSASVNEFFEVCLGGLITLPAAFIFLGVAATTMGTFDLGFKALPNVFAVMPAGRFFGSVWFIMLFLAAITSSISMLQPVIAFFEEGLGLRRHASVALLGLIAALGTGFVVYFSKGLVALDTFDFWVGTFLIYTLAMFQVVLYGWVFGIERGYDELHQGANMRVPRLVQYVLKYVAPAYLLVIFATFCWQSLLNKEEPKLETPMALTELNAPTPAATLVDAMARAELSLPEDAKMTSTGELEWTIEDVTGKPLYRIRPVANGANEEAVEVSAVKLGTIGALRYNQVALAAVGFIAIVAVFLMLLVKIAADRWAREGRLASAVD